MVGCDCFSFFSRFGWLGGILGGDGVVWRKRAVLAIWLRKARDRAEEADKLD